MTRLIDKDYLIEEIRCSPVGQLLIRKHNLDGMIEKFPEVDAVPVRHGTWRHYERMLTCSECGTVFYDDIMEYFGEEVPRYCPECGARMDL